MTTGFFSAGHDLTCCASLPRIGFLLLCTLAAGRVKGYGTNGNFR
jgi:hypothetical protein